MKISIITPVFNGEKTIRDTIGSVFEQTYDSIEYIVVDGESRDGTMQIVEELMAKKSEMGSNGEGSGKFSFRIISEKDRGMYDAMNKGVGMASGDIVGILNADDVYASDKVLEAVMKKFEETDADVVYGDLEYVRRDNINEVVRKWKAGRIEKEQDMGNGEQIDRKIIRKLRNGWVIPHPTLFVKKSVYNKIGLYRDDFKIAGDYEFILRLFHSNFSASKVDNVGVKIEYISNVLVKMREGGASGGGLKKRILGWRELRRAWEVHDLQTPPFFILRRVFLKFGQYFVR